MNVLFFNREKEREKKINIHRFIFVQTRSLFVMEEITKSRQRAVHGKSFDFPYRPFNDFV